MIFFLMRDIRSASVIPIEMWANAAAQLIALQEARYVIESVICDPNFEGLVLGCIEADFCK